MSMKGGRGKGRDTDLHIDGDKHHDELYIVRCDERSAMES
jgi:hypothetical protein